VISIHQRYRRTDGRTDRRTSYDGITAPLLLAWSGKNLQNKMHISRKCLVLVRGDASYTHGNPSAFVLKAAFRYFRWQNYVILWTLLCKVRQYVCREIL